MQIEKNKPNRFRTLVSNPTPAINSHSHITVPHSRNQYHREGTSIKEGENSKSNQRTHSMSRESYQLPLKRFIKEGRMRTISALQEKREQKGKGQLYKPNIEDCNFQFQKERKFQKQKSTNRQKKQLEKWKQMIDLVQQFKRKALNIINMDQAMYQQQYPERRYQEQSSDQLQKFEQLQRETKQRAAKLITIYIKRYTCQLKAFCFRLLQESKTEGSEDYLISVLPIGPPSGQPRGSRQGRNLLNVRKFLDSK